jgi:hypothetical protein
MMERIEAKVAAGMTSCRVYFSLYSMASQTCLGMTRTVWPSLVIYFFRSSAELRPSRIGDGFVVIALRDP